MAIMTGRLRRNSIHGPSGTARSAPTASPAAASADTAAGPACRTRIAISGNASNAIHVPNVLTAYAAHNHRNCRPIRGIPARRPDATGLRLGTLHGHPRQRAVDRARQPPVAVAEDVHH